MEQHTPNTPPEGTVSSEAMAKGYEPQDIGLRPIFMGIFGLVVVLVVVLAAIYAIMMALAASARSDSTPSPIAVTLPAPYAPLQPSLGAYDNHDNDHNLLDAQDMDALRYKATQALNSEGYVGTRHHIPIAAAMEKALPLIQKNAVAVVKAPVEPQYPDGSYEGVYNKDRPARPTGQYNDMNRLNNRGN